MQADFGRFIMRPDELRLLHDERPLLGPAELAVAALGLGRDGDVGPGLDVAVPDREVEVVLARRAVGDPDGPVQGLYGRALGVAALGRVGHGHGVGRAQVEAPQLAVELAVQLHAQEGAGRAVGGGALGAVRGVEPGLEAGGRLGGLGGGGGGRAGEEEGGGGEEELHGGWVSG
ncbi:hypothetical protein PG988_005742 [Apiospora saccharicola]